MNDEAEAMATAQPFWDFSLKLYGQDQVEAHCLELQDNWGFDVNLLLLCIWLGTKGVSLNAESMKILITQSSEWRLQAVLPLRQLRQSLKDPAIGIDGEGAALLRERVKAIELDAERLQQDMLYRTLETLPGKDGRSADRAGIIRGNLSRYTKISEIRMTPELRAMFESLIASSVSH